MTNFVEPTFRELAHLNEYCRRDVETERAITYWCGDDWPDSEYGYLKMDRAMNERGFAIDMDLLAALNDLADIAVDEINAEFAELTGIQKTSQLPRFKLWLAARGAYEAGDKLGSRDIDDLLEKDDLTDECRRALELRALGSKSSLAKLNVAANQQWEGRLTHQFVFNGAAQTGRYSARAWQPQNIPRDALPHSAVPFLLARDVKALTRLYGPLGALLPRALRLLIVASEGNVLVGGDYSQIESRLVAWTARIDWKLDAYERGDDVYIKTASRTYKVAEKDVTDKQRQGGKVLDLACGFQGAHRALIGMARNYGIRYDSELEPRAQVKAWRSAHPELGDQHGKGGAWEAFYLAAKAAVAKPDRLVPVDPSMTRGGICYEYVSDRDILFCRLPSGRRLAYHQPRMVEGRYEYQLEVTTWRYGAWRRFGLYGGYLFQNVIQAMARDIMVDAMYRAWAADCPPVLTIHDEFACEVPSYLAGDGQWLREIMLEEYGWMLSSDRRIPLDTQPWVNARYTKG